MYIYLFIFWKSGREGEREGEEHQGVGASGMLPTRDLASKLGMCYDWESNLQPFGSQDHSQPTQVH